MSFTPIHSSMWRPKAKIECEMEHQNYIQTFSHNGLVTRIYSEKKNTSSNKFVASKFVFNEDKRSFDFDSYTDSSIIAQRADALTLVICAKCCKLTDSSGVSAVLVYKNINKTNSYLVITLNSLLFKEIGIIDNFFQSENFQKESQHLHGISESQIATQSFSAFRNTQQPKGSNKHVTISTIDNIFILNGPSICCFSKEKLYFFSLTGGVRNGTGFEIALPSHIKDLNVLWITISSGVLLLLGTCQSNLATANGKRRNLALRIETGPSGLDNSCTQTVGCKSVDILPDIFFPDIYSEIVSCATVKDIELKSVVKVSETNPTQTQIFDDQRHSSSPQYTCDNVTYICTSYKQCLRFKNGKLQNCVDIPTEHCSEIHQFESFTGLSYLVLESKDHKIIVVNHSSFEVIHVFEQVQEVLIDDFVHNGADQLLLLFEQKPDTEDLGHFILTDCEGLHLDSRKTSNPHPSTDEVCDSLVSAIGALQTRLQAAYCSLHDAERLKTNKDLVIEDICKSLKQTCIDADSEEKPIKSKSSRTLVPLIPYRETDQQCTQTLAAASSQEATSDRPLVSDVWQKLVTSDKWMIGVCVTNLTVNKCFSHVQLAAINITQPSGSNNDGMCSDMFIMDKNRKDDHGTNIPRAKRAKLAMGLRARQVLELSPGESGHVVLMTKVPTFHEHTLQAKIVLSWIESIQQEDTEDSRTLKDMGNGLSSIVSKEIELGVDTFLDPSNSFWLKPNDLHFGSDESLTTSLLCLTMLQSQTILQIASIFSDLNSSMAPVLEGLGFSFVEKLQCYVNLDQDNQLLWSRVAINQPGKCRNIKLDVFVRTSDHLLLLTHALYSKLPDDVLILLASQINEMTEHLPKLIEDLRNGLAIDQTNLKCLLEGPVPMDDSLDVCIVDRASETDRAKYLEFFRCRKLLESQMKRTVESLVKPYDL